MKKNMVLILLSFFILLASTGPVRAGEMDILIDKLVEKEILTRAEATVLLEEMRKESEKEKEEIKTAAAGAVKDKIDVPNWAKNTTLKGDVRVRYQAQDTDNDGKPSRGRGRMRVRAGIESKVNDKWTAGIGMASGGDDPRSNNQTFDDTFDTKSWNLDYAYANYSPNTAVSIIAGKMKNPLYKTKDLIWDSDINPEGVALKLNSKLSDNVKFFGTAAYFLMEEFSSSKKDPAFFALQPGIDLKISDSVSLKLAGAYYMFSNVKGSDLSVHTGGTNSTDVSGNWRYEYDSLALDAELGINFGGAIPYGALFTQYIASDADSEDTGWMAGFKIGDKKIKNTGDWQFKFNYRELEQDAWLDFWPDSDFYNGETGVKGSEFEFVIGLSKNVTFGLDYYRAEPIMGNTDREQSVLQVDLIVKF
ncbi:putative porin [Thermodesulfobacteriota bacterium]